MIQKTNQQNQNLYILSEKSHQSPHTIFTPQPFPECQSWLHPILGYPMCPLIGRYNKGQYRIADVILHLQFICTYHDESKMNNGWSGYRCGHRKVYIPQFLVYSLRNIPQVIHYNKPKNMKTEPDVHLTHHLVQKNLKLNWIIYFGQIGRDFLNYLNHCYIFDESVFFGEKLNRTTYNLPIIAYTPEGSGLCTQEVQRGICTTEWRSEYMSIHLKGGAPAFSPNNMRLGVEGMKKVVCNQNNKKRKNNENENDNKKKKYRAKIEGQTRKQQVNIKENVEQIEKQEDQVAESQRYQQLSLWQQIQQDQKQEKNFKNTQNTQNKAAQNTKTINSGPKFVQFYTAVLLQNDHRVYYHWLIQDVHMQDMIKQIYANSQSVQQFANNYRNIVGEDSLIHELSRILSV